MEELRKFDYKSYEDTLDLWISPNSQRNSDEELEKYRQFRFFRFLKRELSALHLIDEQAKEVILLPVTLTKTKSLSIYKSQEVLGENFILYI